MSRSVDVPQREILAALLEQLTELDNRIIRLEKSTRQFREELSATHPNWHVASAARVAAPKGTARLQPRDGAKVADAQA